jgi:hypothetical protein
LRSILGTESDPNSPLDEHGQALRQRSRASVAVVLQTIGLPVLLKPVAPAAEQKAPGVT